MTDINRLLVELILCLQSLDPYKIVLFGSHARGTPTECSDVDIMVILDNHDVSKTYEERLKKRLFIRNLVLDINRQIPLDILVYSKEELNILKQYGNFFIEEIEKTGKIVYEKTVKNKKSK